MFCIAPSGQCQSNSWGPMTTLAERVYILSEASVIPLSLNGSLHVFICILHSNPSVQQMLKLIYRKRENIYPEVLFKLIVNFSKHTRDPRMTPSSVIFIEHSTSNFSTEAQQVFD